MNSQSTLNVDEVPAAAALTRSFSSQRAATLVAMLLLLLVTLSLYQRATQNGFTIYDDPTYVTANAHVRQGLSWRNIVWAFHSNVAGHWHPLTVISQMADVQLFGLNPAGHHFDSALLHALNVILLFLVLRFATGYIGRSAVVAGLFALSPLNVEAVDWVADRKAVLCTTFLLLALLAYGKYVRRPSASRYLALMLLFACGLMSEATVITLPALLLLVDYWPLNRFHLDASTNAGGRLRRAGKLVIEKIPLLLMSALSAFMTVRAARNGGAVTSLGLFPLRLRIENAIYSYAIYIGKAFWPADLAVIYPHPGRSLAMWKVVAAAILLSAITALVWRFCEKRYLPVGWLWFLVTMLPVSGIVQAGLQGMADRYTYIPFIGLFVLVVWLGAESAAQIKFSPVVPASAALAVLLAYAFISYIQIGYWRDSFTLFTHAAQVTSRNAVAENNLGMLTEDRAELDQAMQHYEAAVEFMPQWCTPHFHLALMLQAQNRLNDAAREYNLALAVETDAGEAWRAYNNLGIISAGFNRTDEAIAEFSAAARINPSDPVSLTNRGVMEYRQRKLDAAGQDIAGALRLAPSPERYYWLGRLQEDQGSMKAAAGSYESAVRLAPSLSDAQSRLDRIRQQVR